MVSICLFGFEQHIEAVQCSGVGLVSFCDDICWPRQCWSGTFTITMGEGSSHRPCNRSPCILFCCSTTMRRISEEGVAGQVCFEPEHRTVCCYILQTLGSARGATPNYQHFPNFFTNIFWIKKCRNESPSTPTFDILISFPKVALSKDDFFLMLFSPKRDQ